MKGFDFDVAKAEQIFDLLLKEKQLKLPEITSYQPHRNCRGGYTVNGITRSLMPRVNARSYVVRFSRLSSKAD